MTAPAIAEALLAQTVQVVLLFGLLVLLDTALARRGHVRLRTVLWAVFLVKLCVPPGMSSPVSVARLLPGSLDGGALVTWSLVSPESLATPDSPESPPAAPYLLLAISIWIAGALASATLVVVRLRRARQTWLDAPHRDAPRAAEHLLGELAARIGLARAPRLTVRDGVACAAAVGLWRPIIVVPTGLLATRKRTALEHVLLHELAHVRRRDALRSLAWTAARCVYWFHPLVHAAARRAALLREMTCDELAASVAHGGASAYRSTLLDLAEPLAHAEPATARFLGGAAHILMRIDRLARPIPRHAPHVNAAAVALFVVLCACCVPLGHASPPPPATPAAAAYPSLDDVQGCMRKRLIVLAAIARDARESHPHE